MPTVENTGRETKYVGTVGIKPNERVETEEYPNPEDTDLVVVSHYPIWKLDMSGKPISEAIATSKEYTVPYGTNTIEIYSKSSNPLKVYNFEEDDENFEMLVPPTTIRYIDKVKNRIQKLVIVGTAAAGEVFVSFSKK